MRNDSFTDQNIIKLTITKELIALFRIGCL